MYIPDPIELLDRRMEREMDLIDENDTYPCCQCDERFLYTQGYPASSAPDSPLLCPKCTEKLFNK